MCIELNHHHRFIQKYLIKYTNPNGPKTFDLQSQFKPITPIYNPVINPIKIKTTDYSDYIQDIYYLYKT